MRSLGGAGAVAVALFLAAGVAFAAVSPARLFSSALAKAKKQRSVHYVASQSFGGKAIRIVGDATRSRGVQHITYRKGGRVGHVTVRVVANTAYVRGDAFTLENYMQMPPSVATALAGKWLSLASSVPDYKTVSAAVRLVSTLDELKTPPPFRRAGTLTLHGVRLVGVQSRFRRAGHAVIETLYIDAARSLPVEQVGRSSGITVKSTFSRWNEAVSIAPPPSAIPIR